MSTPSTPAALPLSAETSDDDRTFVSPSLWFVDSAGYRVIFCRHEPIYRVALDDPTHLRFVCVMLRQSELATQSDLARTFGHSVASQRRWERRYQQHGLDGLARTEDEGRTFLQAAFQSCGSLNAEANEMRVTLAAQSSPHRSRALAALCDKLNALDTCFPGTNLRLRLAVEGHEPLTP